jgi:hypothetical protein
MTPRRFGKESTFTFKLINNLQMLQFPIYENATKQGEFDLSKFIRWAVPTTNCRLLQCRQYFSHTEDVR